MADVELLTAAEVSEMLRVTRQTVRKMIERGELKGFQCGRITRITRDSVEHLVGTPLAVSEGISEVEGSRRSAREVATA